jgi:hypothetical protein
MRANSLSVHLGRHLAREAKLPIEAELAVLFTTHSGFAIYCSFYLFLILQSRKSA